MGALCRQGLKYFQIAYGKSVQPHNAVIGNRSQSRNVGQGTVQGILHVVKNRACCRDAQFHMTAAKPFQRPHAEMLGKCALALIEGQYPIFHRGHKGFQFPIPVRCGINHVLRQQHFPRSEFPQCFRQSGCWTFANKQFSRGLIQHSVTGLVVVNVDARQKLIRFFIQRCFTGDGSGRYHFYHFPLDNSLRQLGIFHLFANGHAMTGVYQFV